MSGLVFGRGMELDRDIYVEDRAQISFRGFSQLPSHGANTDLCRNVRPRTRSSGNVDGCLFLGCRLYGVEKSDQLAEVDGLIIPDLQMAACGGTSGLSGGASAFRGEPCIE